MSHTGDMRERIWANFESFSKTYLEVMDAANTIFSITESVALIDTEKAEILTNAVKIFGAGWRRLAWSITPKVHVTEKHLVPMTISHGLFGICSESIVERMHYVVNTNRRRTHNTGDWKLNAARAYRLIELQYNPAVALEVVNLWRPITKPTPCQPDTNQPQALPEDCQTPAKRANAIQEPCQHKTNENQARCEECPPPEKRRNFQYASIERYDASEMAAKAHGQKWTVIKGEIPQTVIVDE